MSLSKLYGKMNEASLIAGETLAEYRNGGCTYDDLIVLTDWLAERGESAKTVAYAVEKPWKYAAELSLAKAVLEHETSFKSGPVHQCQPRDDGSWYCGVEWSGDVENFCDWSWTPPDE
jgi:hypothetical protein